jgi:hypothetical protein
MLDQILFSTPTPKLDCLCVYLLMLVSHTRFLSIDISFGYSIKNTDDKNMINSNKYLIGKYFVEQHTTPAQNCGLAISF